MDELKIVVSGPTGVGKSAILENIYRMLWVQGFEVEMNFEMNHDYKDEADFRRKMLVFREERLNAVKEKTKITLMEMQTKREEQKDSNEQFYEGQD